MPRIHTIEVYTQTTNGSVGLCTLDVRHDSGAGAAANELIEALVDHLATRSRTTTDVYHVRRTSRDEPDQPEEVAA